LKNPIVSIVLPLRAILALIACVVSLSCGSSGNSNALAPPGISTVVITNIFPAITPPTSSRAQAVAIQADGKIVAAGYADDGTKNVFALARYNSADGSLDPGFGTGGIVTTPVGSVDAEGRALAIQTDGKLVAVGFSFNGSQEVFTLVRYNEADGSLDGAFGSGGVVTTAIGSLDDRAFAVAIQPDGKIVVAGYTSAIFNSAVQSSIAVVRYNTDGSLDTAGFGTNGVVITTPDAVSASGAAANGLVIQPADQKLVVAGVASGAPVTIGSTTIYEDTLLVARYNPNGSVDATWNGGNPSNLTGLVTTAIGTAYEKDEASAVAIDQNGKVVVAGSTYVTLRTLAVVRYNTDGSLDITFNGTGKVSTTIQVNAGATALSLSTNAQLVEQIVVAGVGYNNTYPEFILARYNPTGQLDPTFGSGGTVFTEIMYGAEAFGLAIQSDGQPIAAGYSHGFPQSPPQPLPPQQPDMFTLVRYTTSGIVDTTFPPPPP